MFHKPVIGLLLIILSYYFNLFFIQRWTKKGTLTLAIGILSARENNVRRLAIRKSWLNISSAFRQDSLDSSKAWFIVGDESCDVSPKCRISEYGCKHWGVNISEVARVFHTSGAHLSDSCNHKDRKKLYSGFSFQVHSPVIANKLGIASELLIDSRNTSILLVDVQTMVIVVQVSISNNDLTNSQNGYSYKEIPNFLLPKGYEGMLIIEGSFPRSICSVAKWNNNSGVISFNRLYEKADHLESVEFSIGSFPATSMELEVDNMPQLEDSVSFCKDEAEEWKLYTEKLSRNLIEESKEFGDLVFVNTVDTYRNLPLKLLLFYKWLVSNYDFSFMLKTDDDCVLNIQKVLHSLRDDMVFDPEKMLIWSRFRKNWPINYIGKWAEFDYKSTVYPAFPCGLGYVLSWQMVHWLQHNIDHLHPYQGEDVSLGIWMTAVNPLYIEDENWQCRDECSPNSYNRGQLTPEEIEESWLRNLEHGHFCQNGT